MSDQAGAALVIPVKRPLAWISGTVAVISLVLGVAALNAAVEDWRETRATVEQLVGGADAALAAGDYRLAKSGFDEAMTLDASSPVLRESRTTLALVWLRAILDDRRSDETFNALTESLLPSLYEGLEGKPAADQSIIWSHIGWAQHVVSLDQQIVNLAPEARENIERIYERARALDPDNFYAPLYAGILNLEERWDVTAAERDFEQAIARAEQRHGTASAEYRWTREMVLRSCLARRSVSIRRGSEADEVGLVLLRWLDSMRAAGDSLPQEPYVAEVLSIFQSAVQFDDDFALLMSALPLPEYRATYEWLLTSETAARRFGLESNAVMLLAMHAALLEGADPDQALELYLEAYELSGGLAALRNRVDEGIARLSGEPPPRMLPRLGRNFARDPIPESSDVHAFHLETLMNFDLQYMPPNGEAAFEYFRTLPGGDSEFDARVLGEVTAARGPDPRHISRNEARNRWGRLYVRKLTQQRDHRNSKHAECVSSSHDLSPAQWFSR